MEKAQLKIKNNGKGIIKVGRAEINVPTEYDLTNIESTECEILRENGRLISIFVAGIEVPKLDQEVKKKEIQNQRKEEEKKEAAILKQNTKKSFPLSNQNTNLIIQDSFNQSLAKLPNGIPNINKDDLLTSNFSLKMYKFARFDSKDGKAKFYSGPKSSNFCIKHNDYGLGDKIKDLASQHLKTAQLLFSEEESLKSACFKPDWRFVVGLGTDSVYETGITLHYIYGFPYIPSSGIKGITRSHVIVENFNNKEDEAFKNKEFCDIFGCTSKSIYEKAKQGKITFFDAMPTEVPQIKPDIMNVHYPDYYNGSRPPTDTQNPNPIFFLTVENTPYQFMLGCKDEDKPLLNIAFNWLKEALEYKGIGAKTAVGYGYLNSIDEK